MTDPPQDRLYLRLNPLPITGLPDHPLLSAHQTTSNTATTTAPPPPSLHNLSVAILNEASNFLNSTIPDKFKVKGSSRSSPPSTARVDLLTAALPSGGRAADGNPRTDAWFARRSYHSDEATNGAATWEEFQTGLFHNHSENEMKYTPDVFDARQILKWDYTGSSESNPENTDSTDHTGRAGGDGAAAASGGVEGWTDVGMVVYEMAHKIPAPLENRVFAVLVVRGKPKEHKSPREFITAQVPVDLSQFSGAFYSNGRNRTEGESAVQKEKITLGQYTAVERVRKLEDGLISWEMATASDAKGWLPMGLQKMGVPGAVIKDVGYFIGWTDEQRKASKPS